MSPAKCNLAYSSQIRRNIRVPISNITMTNQPNQPRSSIELPAEQNSSSLSIGRPLARRRIEIDRVPNARPRVVENIASRPRSPDNKLLDRQRSRLAVNKTILRQTQVISRQASRYSRRARSATGTLQIAEALDWIGIRRPDVVAGRVSVRQPLVQVHVADHARDAVCVDASHDQERGHVLVARLAEVGGSSVDGQRALVSRAGDKHCVFRRQGVQEVLVAGFEASHVVCSIWVGEEVLGPVAGHQDDRGFISVEVVVDSAESDDPVGRLHAFSWSTARHSHDDRVGVLRDPDRFADDKAEHGSSVGLAIVFSGFVAFADLDPPRLASDMVKLLRDETQALAKSARWGVGECCKGTHRICHIGSCVENVD
jgi:hypothetical protein